MYVLENVFYKKYSLPLQPKLYRSDTLKFWKLVDLK